MGNLEIHGSFHGISLIALPNIKFRNGGLATGRKWLGLGPKSKYVNQSNTINTDYKSLYNFLAVLDENQVHKLHKIVSGILDISAFSASEIIQLENRLSLSDMNKRVLPMISN